MPHRLHKEPNPLGPPDTSIPPVIHGQNPAAAKTGAANKYTALTDEERQAIVQKAALARLAEAKRR